MCSTLGIVDITEWSGVHVAAVDPLDLALA
jgi:hypothetical protein